MQHTIAIAGTGNLGHHLAVAFSEAGHNVLIWNRTRENSVYSSKACNCSVLDKLSDIPDAAEICIISVNETAIAEVCNQLNKFQGLVAHTSGSVSMEVLNHFFSRTGVLYPLQTFTKTRIPDYSTIPVFIEAEQRKDIEFLKELCSSIFHKVYELDSDKRKFLHLSAVFACNFVNASLLAAQEICEENKLDFSLLLPLIRETITKSELNLPSFNQTGPAMRNNTQIIEKQIEMLQNKPQLLEIYKSITNYITEYFKR